MSITDELRGYADLCDGPTRNSLRVIADRIDAEHESACAEAYGNGVQSVALPDMTAYVKLPVDADGVPIRVGDVVAATLAHGGSGRWVVDRMELTRAYDQDLWQIALDKDGACWVTPSTVRHHHAPTVENVLREFAEKVIDSQIPSVHPTYEEAIAEYAAKLRLAGDAE